jgi:arylsulfatase A-like enzyme/Flp pilus assembly protein TadD
MWTERRAQVIVLLLPLAAVLVHGPRPAAAGPPPPNLLLVTLDTMRADRLGAYGYDAATTPAFDALAREGTLFLQAFTSTPMTLPAHATLLTGLEPPAHGVRVNGLHRLDDEVTVLAEELRRHGYLTAAFIAAFVLDDRFGLARGFDLYDDDLGDVRRDLPDPLAVHRPGAQVADAALAWLAEAMRDEPFFCWVHLYDTHFPYGAATKGVRKPTDAAASYDEAVATTDAQLARLVDFLRARGLRDRTLVVVVGDHGEGLREHGELEHGFQLHQEVLRVPLVMALPGRVAAGHRADAVVSLADVPRSILEVLGLPADRLGGGRSLAPALRGEPLASVPSYAETELPWAMYRWAPQRSLTTPDWKYVRSPRPELYDRGADPRERRNLAAERPDVVARLDAELRRREEALRPRAPQSASLDADARRRLEALGYLAPGERAAGDTPAAPPPRDVKDMLRVRDLEADLQAGMVDGSISQDEAQERLRALIALSPETPAFHFGLGSLMAADGDDAGAVPHLRRATALQPDLAEAHVNLAVVLVSLGQRDEARRAYVAALAADPKLVEAHLGLSTLLADDGRFADALREAEFAVRHGPDKPQAATQLAWLLATSPDASLRDGTRAVTVAERAVALTSRREPRVLDVLAAALAEAGRFDDAVAAAREAETLAAAGSAPALVAAIAARRAGYERDSPYRRPAPAPR